MGFLKNQPHIHLISRGCLLSIYVYIYIYIYIRIYIYNISPFQGVLAALSFKKLMASLISQDSVIGKYSSGEYPRQATPENCRSGF